MNEEPSHINTYNLLLFQVKYIKSKGRGVFATQDFHRGEFVVEYSGDLINIQEAYLREEKYNNDNNTGCYMYYFKYREQPYW